MESKVQFLDFQNHYSNFSTKVDSNQSNRVLELGNKIEVDLGEKSEPFNLRELISEAKKVAQDSKFSVKSFDRAMVYISGDFSRKTLRDRIKDRDELEIQEIRDMRDSMKVSIKQKPSDF